MDKLLLEIMKLQTAVDGLAVELQAQQRRNFTDSDFLIAEFRSLTNAVKSLRDQVNAQSKSP